ncbi:MAG: PASTA domain-containing protein [Candidatus Dormibacteria bacterium]
MTFRRGAVPMLAAGLLFTAGCAASPSQVALPPMARAWLLQTVVVQSGLHPDASFDWVKLNGQSVDNWEQSQDSSGKNTSSFSVSYAPTAEFYLMELRGHFASSTGQRTVAFELVATETTGWPTKRGVTLSGGTWFSNRFTSLSRLGRVNHGLVPPSPKLINGRVPNLVGLGFPEAEALLHRLGLSVKAHNILHFDPYLPPFTVVSQTPKSGQYESSGGVQVTVNM